MKELDAIPPPLATPIPHPPTKQGIKEWKHLNI